MKEFEPRNIISVMHKIFAERILRIKIMVSGTESVIMIDLMSHED